MLCNEALELTAVKLVLKLIVDKSLSDQLADDHFDLSFLLQEPIVLANFNFVVLNKLEKLAFLCTFLCHGSIALDQPPTFSFNLFRGRRLICVEELA